MQKKGVTLIEIIVATLLFSVIMFGMVNLYLTAKRYVLHSRYKNTGGQLGKFFLDPLQMDVRNDQWGTNCLSGGAGCPVNQTIYHVNYIPNYTINNVAATDLRRVILTINWSEQN
ncbi:MAG: prepilin-type N-terminal cleavage/methylation domain-containing protein [Candidatus Omnitrophota bacterium]